MASAFELLGVDLGNPGASAGVEDFEVLAQFVSELVQLRTQHNLTQKAVADAMGTTQSVVSKLETVGGNPTVRSLQRYVRAIGYCLELSSRPAVTAGIWHEATLRSIGDPITVQPRTSRADRGSGPWRDQYARTA